MQFRSTTYYEKAPESPNETWAADASRVLRQYIIAGDAASRYQAARDFLGYSQLKSDFVGGVKQWYVSRVTPHPLGYQTLDGQSFLYAQSIPQTVELGVGRADATFPDLAGYTRSQVHCEYRTLTFDVREDAQVLAGSGTLLGLPDEGWCLANTGGSVLVVAKGGDAVVPHLTASRYVTRVFRPGGKFLVLRAGMMRYVDGTTALLGALSGTPLPEGLPVTVPWLSASYVWHQVPVAGYPGNAALQALGTVNDAAFDGWPAQTMLLLSATPRPYRDAFGNRVLDVEYQFKILPNMSRPADPVATPPVARGHNWTLRVNATTGKLDYVQLSSDGTLTGDPPYRATSFELLFKPDQNPVP